MKKKNLRNIIAIVVLIAIFVVVFQKYQARPTDYYSMGGLVHSDRA